MFPSRYNMNSNVATSGGCAANTCGMSTQQTNVWDDGCSCGNGLYNSCGKNRYIIPVEIKDDSETKLTNYLKNKKRRNRKNKLRFSDLFNSKPKPNFRSTYIPPKPKTEYYHRPRPRIVRQNTRRKVNSMMGVF